MFVVGAPLDNPALELDIHSAHGGRSIGTGLSDEGGGGALGSSMEGGRLLLGELNDGFVVTQPQEEPGSLGVGSDGRSIGESGYSTIGSMMGAETAAPEKLELAVLWLITAPGAETAAPCTAGLRVKLVEDEAVKCATNVGTKSPMGPASTHEENVVPVPAFCGHSARKCVSLLHTEQRMT